MLKTLLPLCALAGLLLCHSNSTRADEASAEAIAKRCANAVDQIVDRCTNAAADETAECVKKIRRLLAAGEEQAAIRVARECVASATERTEKCVQRIDRLCSACIDLLVELGETQLARRLNRFCEEAIEHLWSILERETNAIRTALNGG
jgi:hypothetical protein